MNNSEIMEQSYRIHLAARAPAEEIDGMLGQSRPEAADFIGIPVEDYRPRVHYVQCVAKARFMWADAMIKESNK